MQQLERAMQSSLVSTLDTLRRDISYVVICSPVLALEVGDIGE